VSGRRATGRRLAVALLLALAGCGSPAPHSIAAADYDQTCQAVVDCVPIAEGPIGCCGLESCPNAAIRQDALARYTSDLEARTPRCTPPPPCAPPPVDCTGRVACTNGVCALLVPGGNGASTN
jgi:hypothetical protein